MRPGPPSRPQPSSSVAFRAAASTASMTAAVKPPRSSARMPWMVVPARRDHPAGQLHGVRAVLEKARCALQAGNGNRKGRRVIEPGRNPSESHGMNERQDVGEPGAGHPRHCRHELFRDLQGGAQGRGDCPGNRRASPLTQRGWNETPTSDAPLIAARLGMNRATWSVPSASAIAWIFRPARIEITRRCRGRLPDLSRNRERSPAASRKGS